MRNARLAVLVGVVGLLVAAQQLGLFARFSDIASIRHTLLALGPWGYVAFVAAYTVLQPFGVPGTVFIMVAPLVWPWPVAFALSMVGTCAASVVGFSFARFMARDWLAQRIPARFRAYDEALAKRAFATVFTLRLVFWMPPLLHAFFGVSKVRFSTHLGASAAGYVLPLFVVSFFGQRVFDAMRAVPLAAWLGLGAAAALGGAVYWAVRRRANSALPSQ